MAILALDKVSYSYKSGKRVLNEISMEFERGKFYTILGVSGSGKTTLLSLWAKKSDSILVLKNKKLTLLK